MTVRAIVRPIVRTIVRGIAGGLVATNRTPSNRVVVAEGDSLTATNAPSSISYARRYEPRAVPSNNTFSIQAQQGATTTGNGGNSLTSRAATVDALLVAGGENILTVLIGRNDLSVVSTWCTTLAAYLDARRAAGWYVILGTICPSTSVGYNALRNTANTELRLWTTNGSLVPGRHADQICDFAADATMGPDAAASDTSLYYDGTHPTDTGQIALLAVYTAALALATPSTFVAAPQFSVAPGIYASTQSVTLTSATPGATIYYTTDNTVPTSASSVYSGAISVSSAQTIRAFAVKAGLTASPYSVGAYTIGASPPNTNLLAWYKQNTGIALNGSNVSQWDDRTGNGYHVVQATASKQPAYSASSGGIIDFDGVNDFLQKVFAVPAAAPITVYLLVRQDAWTSSAFLFDGTGGFAGMWQYDSTPKISGYAGGAVAGASQATIGSFFPVCVCLNGASSYVRVGNNAKVTGNFGSRDNGGVTFGGSGAGSQCANITLKEAAYYLAAHSDAECDAVMTYLLGL